MGVLNVTPDSFSDGGHYNRVPCALSRAKAMVAAGASILDIGGESTRPGFTEVSDEEEIHRVVPVIEALVAAHLPAILSVDTRKARVAKAALTKGVHLINDVSTLRDPAMAEVLAEHNAAVILMHSPPELTRDTSHEEAQASGPVHGDCAGLHETLRQAIEKAETAGIPRSHILIDPGLGFGKTTEANLRLTYDLSALLSFHMPIVYGPSRKRFLGDIIGKASDERDIATAAVCAIAALAGAHIFRVHNVALARDALLVADAVRHSAVG